MRWGHAGGSYRFYTNQYGIPGGYVGGHDDGVTIDMQRHTVRGESELVDLVAAGVGLDPVVSPRQGSEVRRGGGSALGVGVVVVQVHAARSVGGEGEHVAGVDHRKQEFLAVLRRQGDTDCPAEHRHHLIARRSHGEDGIARCDQRFQH